MIPLDVRLTKDYSKERIRVEWIKRHEGYWFAGIIGSGLLLIIGMLM